MAFVRLLSDKKQFRHAREVERKLMAFPDMNECHIISGDFDCRLKVVALDLKALSSLLSDTLMQVPGLATGPIDDSHGRN